MKKNTKRPKPDSPKEKQATRRGNVATSGQKQKEEASVLKLIISSGERIYNHPIWRRWTDDSAWNPPDADALQVCLHLWLTYAPWRTKGKKQIGQNDGKQNKTHD